MLPLVTTTGVGTSLTVTGPHRESGGEAGEATSETAIPGRHRCLWLPHHRRQRRDCRCCPGEENPVIISNIPFLYFLL